MSGLRVDAASDGKSSSNRRWGGDRANREQREINRVRNAADRMRERLTTAEFDAPDESLTAPRELPRPMPPRDVPRGAPAAPLREAPRDEQTEFDEAHTQVINGRHRRNVA